MSDQDPYTVQVARQVADLRLQVNAIAVTAKNGSLPDMLRQTRRMMIWSALLVAAALIASSFIRVQREEQKIRALEQRVEELSRGRTAP